MLVKQHKTTCMVEYSKETLKLLFSKSNDKIGKYSLYILEMPQNIKPSKRYINIYKYICKCRK